MSRIARLMGRSEVGACFTALPEAGLEGDGAASRTGRGWIARVVPCSCSCPLSRVLISLDQLLLLYVGGPVPGIIDIPTGSAGTPAGDVTRCCLPLASRRGLSLLPIPLAYLLRCCSFLFSKLCNDGLRVLLHEVAVGRLARRCATRSRSRRCTPGGLSPDIIYSSSLPPCHGAACLLLLALRHSQKQAGVVTARVAADHWSLTILIWQVIENCSWSLSWTLTYLE